MKVGYMKKLIAEFRGGPLNGMRKEAIAPLYLPPSTITRAHVVKKPIGIYELKIESVYYAWKKHKKQQIST